MNARIPCRAVFLDAGGVLVLPRRDLVAAAVYQASGIEIDPANVPAAHYAVVHRLDRGDAGSYFELLCAELGVPPARSSEAIASLEQLGDRARSDEVLWSEPTPHALTTIIALAAAGISVLVVSNSDGYAEDNLRAAAICQPGPGPGAAIASVIDSTLVGVAKPDPGIFHLALGKAHATSDSVVHVGDMLSTDVAGARAAGIEPVHFDPARRCRARSEHRHVRSLRGIWRHVVPAAHRAPSHVM